MDSSAQSLSKFGVYRLWRDLGAGDGNTSAYDAGAHKVVVDSPLEAFTFTKGRFKEHRPAAHLLRFWQVRALPEGASLPSSQRMLASTIAWQSALCRLLCHCAQSAVTFSPPVISSPPTRKA